MADRDLRFNIFANDRASAAFARVAAAAEALSNRIVRLDGQRADVTIDANTAPLEAKLAQVKAQLARLQATKTDPRIDPEIREAQAKIVLITSQLERLRTMEPSPKVNANIATAEANIVRLTRKIEELDRQRADPKVDADIAAAEAKIKLIEEQLKRLRDGVDVRVRTGEADRDLRSLGGTLRDVQRSFVDAINSSAQFTRNLRQIAVPGALAGMLPTIASLGASFAEMSTVIAAAPAGVLALGAAFGTLAVSFSGFKDALGPTDTVAKMKKVNLALAQMGDEAKEVIGVIRGFAPAWSDLKKTVQDTTFKYISEQFRELGEKYIPILKNGLVGIAGNFNSLFQQMGRFLDSSYRFNDVQVMLSLFGEGVRRLNPGIMSMTAAFLDFGAVGARFIPVFTNGFSEMMGRFERFTAQARADGSIEQWIARGAAAIREFGQLLSNIGGILNAVFDASRAAGASFITVMKEGTQTLEDFAKSARGQIGLVALFQGIRDAIRSIAPGVKEVLGSIADAFAILQPAVLATGNAFSQLAINLAPTITMLATLAANVIPPIADAFAAVTSALGPLVPMLLTAAIAFKALTGVGAILATIGVAATTAGNALGMLGLRLGLAGAAAQSFATAGATMGAALTRVGNSLPLIGIAVLGLVAVYDAWGTKADEVAQKVVSGSMSMQTAINLEARQIHANQIEWLGGMNAAESYSVAQANVERETHKLLAVMGPLERAQAEVGIAQGNLNDKIAQFGRDSPQAVAAAGELSLAQDRLETEQLGAATATKSHTDRMIEQADAAFAAANADVGYEQALIRLKEAQNTAAEAVKNHGIKSDEARKALLDLEQQNLTTAAAAGRKAEADAEATGAANAHEIGARAQKDELIRLANQATGPTRDALLNMANGNDQATRAASTAEIQARLQKDELSRLAGMSTGPLASALNTAKNNFDTLGGAHINAETRARLQKEELNRLAGMASGPVRTELERMANQVRTLPDGDFTVTANGNLGQWLNANPQLFAQLATGGILPGYTPGRDVHLAALSGGEAVMRPEWTRAMGTGYVNAANQAARVGGVPGVRDFTSHTLRPVSMRPEEYTEPYAKGGIQHFAMGGFVRSGISPAQQVKDAYYRTRDAQVASMLVRIRQEMDKAKAAMMGGGGWQWQMQMLRGRFPGLQLISGFRPGAITATGNPSYHGKGLAVDIPPRMDVFNWIASTFGNPATKELIFSPAGGRQLHNGAPHMYTGITRAQHFDHIHWAYMGAGPGGGGGPAGGAGTERWRGTVLQALGMVGQPGSLANTTLRRMQQESGGNPRAINNWDINARRGTPSKGLMQVIDPTFAANWDPRTARDIWNPLSNIVASMRYTLKRYGSLPAGYNRAGGYDQGGVARGSGFMLKNTIRPERVLSPSQTESFDRLVSVMSRGTSSRASGTSGHQNVAGEIRGAVREAVMASRSTHVETHVHNPTSHSASADVARVHRQQQQGGLFG